MHSDVKLLPCPFCGSDDIMTHKATTRCGSCWVFVEEISNEAAIQCWNTRAAPPQEPALLSAEQRQTLESVRKALCNLLYVYGTDDESGEPLPDAESKTLGYIIQGRLALNALTRLLEGKADA